MRKRTIFGLVCVILFVAVGVRETISFVRWGRVRREFATVQVGQTRVTVVGKLGKPNYYAGRCSVLADGPPGCATEYVYGHPFAPLDPEYYVVSFSADERAIDAYRYVSP